MILAHHMGEELLPTLMAGGGSAVSMLLLVWRARLNKPGRPAEEAVMTVEERTTAEAAIVSAVLDYFEGWFDGDAARMERALHPGPRQALAGRRYDRYVGRGSAAWSTG